MGDCIQLPYIRIGSDISPLSFGLLFFGEITLAPNNSFVRKLSVPSCNKVGVDPIMGALKKVGISRRFLMFVEQIWALFQTKYRKKNNPLKMRGFGVAVCSDQ